MRILFLLLLSVSGYGQIFQKQNTPMEFRGLKVDTMLVIPAGIDTPLLSNPKWGAAMDGALFLKTGDTTLWMKAGQSWVKSSIRVGIPDFIDSTGNFTNAVIFAKNGKLIGSARFVYDSINGELTVPLIRSDYIETYSGMRTEGPIEYLAPSAAFDTTNYKPLAIYSGSEDVIKVLPYWPGGGSTIDSSNFAKLNSHNFFTTRNSFQGLNVNKDSIRITTSNVYVLTVDTPTNKVQRRNISTIGIQSLSAIGSTPNANGATITGSVLNFQPADTTFGGVVTTLPQIFKGAKTFNDSIQIYSPNGRDPVFRAIGGLGNLLRIQYNGNTRLSVATDVTVTTGTDFGVNSIVGNSNNPLVIQSNSSSVSTPNTQFNFKSTNATRTMLGIATGQTLTGGASPGQVGGLMINPTLNFSTTSDWTGIDINPTITSVTGKNYGLLVRSGQVGIGTATPSGLLNVNGQTYIGSGTVKPSALFEGESTTQGVLLPRMTAANRNAISSPASGLIFEFPYYFLLINYPVTIN